MKRLKARLRSWLRVPERPEPPAGGPGTLRSFRASPNYLRYLLVSWGFKQAAALWGLVFGLLFLTQAEDYVPDFEFGILFGLIEISSGPALLTLEVFAWATFVIQFFASLITVLLDYDLRWYLVTDRSLRIREGVLKVKEKTQSFANIQNISIERGPVQRLLGIADLQVRTAGGGEEKSGESEKQDHLHTAYFRGVDNAQEIRDVILQRLRRYRDSGLGDPDEPEVAAPGVSGEDAEDGGWEPGATAEAGVDGAVREAVREVLEAASSLRRGRA